MARKINFGTGKYGLGASYYPEWWPEEEWRRDFAVMADLGLNTVRMGEFAWNWYEPNEGEYNFEPMRRAVALAAEYGISTVMCTTTAVCPAWLYQKYPEVKGGNTRGLYNFGGRKGNCLSSEIFLEYARKITTEQAKAFAKDPNVIGWQLDNEPGFPFVDYDPTCEKKFQKWLQKRYGTIEELNKAWFTMMWSVGYTAFDQIRLPINDAEGGWTPGMTLDYRRFFSDNFNNLLSMEASIIRDAGSTQFIYTNWPGANWSVSCEDAQSYLDYAAWDNYVPVPVNDDYLVQLRSSMEHDMDRRLSHGKNRFLVAEQCAAPHANAAPEGVRAQTWLDIAQGAFATIFFELRTPLGGLEQGYQSIIEPDGSVNRCESVFRELSKNISRVYDKLDGAVTESPVAAIYSYHSSWATPGWTVDGPYDDEFFKSHGGLKNQLRQNVDVLFPSDSFKPYRIITAPNLMILTDNQRERLEQYVEDGGVLILNPTVDTRTKENLLRRAARPGLFGGKCGAKVIATIDARSMAEQQKDTGESVAVRFADGREYAVRRTLYELQVEPDAEVIATYTCGRLKGKPAVVVKHIGKGAVVLYGPDSPDYRYFMAVTAAANEIAKVQPLLDVPDGVIVSARRKDEDTYLIAVNMKNSPANFTLDQPLYDMLADKEISGPVTIGGLDVLVAKIL